MQVKIQIAGAGHGDALHSFQRGDQRNELLGDFAGRLAQLLGQLKTARQRDVAHLQIGRRVERGRGNLQIERRAHSLHKLGLYPLLDLR